MLCAGIAREALGRLRVPLAPYQPPRQWALSLSPKTHPKVGLTRTRSFASYAFAWFAFSDMTLWIIYIDGQEGSSKILRLYKPQESLRIAVGRPQGIVTTDRRRRGALTTVAECLVDLSPQSTPALALLTAVAGCRAPRYA